MDNKYSLLNLLSILGKWKKHILIATAIAALLSVIGSLLLPTYYKSTAIVYAASPHLANPAPIGNIDKDFFVYGNADDLDRLFSFANSGEVKEHLVEKFNLYDVYEINKDGKKAKAKIFAKFEKLYTTTKTKYDALVLSIEDKDPQRAKDMVTAAREFITKVAQERIKDSHKKLLESKKQSLAEQEKRLVSYSDSLIALKDRYGIYSVETQPEVYAELVTSTKSQLQQQQGKLGEMQRLSVKRDSINKTKAKIAGLQMQFDSLKSEVKQFNSGIQLVAKMERQTNLLTQEISFDRERIQKLETSYDADFAVVLPVEKESVPFDKSRPKRSLIVIGFTFLAFALSSLFALFMESAKDINWREIFDGKHA